jgi:hypothetical protein
MYPFNFNTMSLVTAIIGKDGIILASDSAETEVHEYQQFYNAHKIEKVTDTVWIACVSNDADVTNCLIDDFQHNIRKRRQDGQEQLDVRAISKYFEVYVNRRFVKLKHLEDPLARQLLHSTREQIAVIIAGYTDDATPNPEIRASEFYRGVHAVPFQLRKAPSFKVSGAAQEIALYWIGKVGRAEPLSSIGSPVLEMLTILIFVEARKATRFVEAPLEMVAIKPGGTSDKITISKAELKKMGGEMKAMIGEDIIFRKLTQLAGKLL